MHHNDRCNTICMRSVKIFSWAKFGVKITSWFLLCLLTNPAIVSQNKPGFRFRQNIPFQL